MCNEKTQEVNTVAEDFLQNRRRNFDRIIGQTDRCLSEILLLAKERSFYVDLADRQTLRHHAEDLIAVGTAMLKALR